MMYGIYRIDQILKCSDLDFSMKEGAKRENVEYIPLNYILDDYIEMFKMLSEIKEIIDKMMLEDEKINIGKLMAEQEGGDNEL